jgi:hypothetical protein
MKMYTENILRDIKELIYDTKRNWSNVHKSKTDAFRDDDLEEALWGLDQACDAFSHIEGQLTLLIENIEMEALSAKVQAK